ncbi:hypothetical protein Gotur_024581 [Gossypium turneri]
MLENKGYHEGVVQTASSLVSLIYSYYKEVQVLGEVCSPRVGHHKRKCYSPTKLDSNGLILGASTQFDHYVSNAFVVEARVFIQMVSFADDLRLREENMVSHLLVIVGFNLGMDHFWVEKISVEVEVVVATDIWWVDLPD